MNFTQGPINKLWLEIFTDKEPNNTIESKERLDFEKRMDRDGYKKLAVQCFPKKWTNSMFLIGSKSNDLCIDLDMIKGNVDYLTGSKLWPGSICYAENYGGHQYGSFRNLGDGRTVTIGYVEQNQVQLRGSNKTPFSSKKDGMIPLSTNVYEFFVSEYLYAIKIPTARNVCITMSTNPCARGSNKDIIQCCGITMRYCPSWIRFGTLEFLHYRGEKEKLKSLVDHVIESFYPECIKREGKVFITSHRLIDGDLYDKNMDFMDESILVADLKDQQPVKIPLNRYALFFSSIVDKTADLVARWQAYGFVHGLLNTVVLIK